MAWEPLGRQLPSLILALSLLVLPLVGGEAHASDEAPEIEFAAPPAWLGISATTGYHFEVTACDEEELDRLAVTVEGLVVATEEGPADCLRAEPSVAFSEPGPYEVQAHVDENPNEEAHATHVVPARLLPWDLDRVEGFPPLDEVPPTTAASFMDIRMLLSTDGSVKGYDVAANGQIVLSNMEDLVPEEGDQSVTILLDRPAGHGEFRVGGQTLWEGTVFPVDTKWWRVRSVQGLLQVPLG